MFAYMVWRALRTLTPGYGYIYSIPFWAIEAASFVMSNFFVIGLWYMIERPERNLSNMIPDPERYPHVDVFIVCYTGESILVYYKNFDQIVQINIIVLPSCGCVHRLLNW